MLQRKLVKNLPPGALVANSVGLGTEVLPFPHPYSGKDIFNFLMIQVEIRKAVCIDLGLMANDGRTPASYPSEGTSDLHTLGL